MITLENKKIHDLIVEKDRLVEEGRAASRALEDLQKKITGYENKERAITSKVKVKDLEERGNVLNDECQKKFEELQKIIEQIEKKRLEAIPKDIKDEHMALLKEREKMERDLNKIALKVQKVKDRVVPLIQKEVTPLLKEYDDIETAKTKDGKVLIATFNHVDDFKSKFKKR
jgi:predicted  nucleic acid-binding Zn-ribbon protein